MNSESGRYMTVAGLERAKQRAIEAPETAFMNDTENPKDWNHISAQLEVKISEEKFKKWVRKYQDLLEELQYMNEDSEHSKWFYVSTFGFNIVEPYFKSNKKAENTNDTKE